jgi:hypothetical protein
VGSQAWTFVTDGTDLDHGPRMRLWLILAVLLCWPFAVLGSLRARRRLRAYLHADTGHLTLERVA